MSPRSQLAKLRKDLGAVQADDEVQAISRLIDELSAEAAGGSPRAGMTLADYFEPEAPPPNNERNTR